MDTPLSSEIIRKRHTKRKLIIAFSVLCFLSVIWLIRFSFKPVLVKSSFTTAKVEKGNVENTINASGIILPEFEEVISSPINASIQKVLTDAGNYVDAGKSILTLDKSTTQTELEKLEFQVESKGNEIKKLKLELAKSFFDLQSNNEVKQLRINSLDAAVENAKRLFKAGGGTKEDIEQAELSLKIARLEKKQLENEITSKQQTMRVEIRESEIAASIEQNDLKELQRKLLLANISAARPGVITWVNKNIGATIREGEPLVRIANLGSFKVVGSISDNYIDQLHKGMAVIIRINETRFNGLVVNIYPAVQNGIVSFDIALDERNNKLYRPDMKVDLFLVTDRHNDVFRVANGPAFSGSPVQDIFVISNGKAIRKTVHTGMSNFDYIEIKDNVQPGDVVITSDMSNYKNANEVAIKN